MCSGRWRFSIGVSLLQLHVIALVAIIAIGTPVAYCLERFTAASSPSEALGNAAVADAAGNGSPAERYGPYSSVGHLAEAVGVILTQTPRRRLPRRDFRSDPRLHPRRQIRFQGSRPRDRTDVPDFGQDVMVTFWRITMPLSRLGLIVGIAIAWVRVVGEFGIVLIMASFPRGSA